jgi:tetratricopeptide (TPR) repeat protein
MRRAHKDSRKSVGSQRRRQAARVNVGIKALTDTQWFWLILCGALVLRLIYLWQIAAIPLFENLAGDGRVYDEWAQRIAARDWLGQGVFYQAPLYPYFLGVLQFVVGHNLWLIRFWQIIVGAFSCAVIYLVGKNLFSRAAGIAAGLLLAIYAPAIFFDVLIEKSILDIILLSLLLFILLDRGMESHWAKWFVAGALLGLFGLSRENALILVPVIALWLLLQFANQPLALRARWLGLFFAGLLLVLFPVGLRNLSVGGEFKLTTSQLGANFYIGNNPAANGTYGSIRNIIHENQLEGPDAKRLAERALGRTLTAGEVSSYWLGQALEYVRAQPTKWLRLLGLKWLLVWNAREIEDSDDFYIYQSWSWLLKLLGWINHFGILAPLAAVGFWLTRDRWRYLWPLYAMILALAASVAIFYVFGRYRYPLVPLLVLFAGAGVVEAARLFRDRVWTRLVPALLILVAAGVIVNWPLQKVSGAGAAGYNNLANAYAKQGRVDEAIKTALQAIAVQPDYGVAHYNLGNLYVRQGNFDLAKQHFEAALRLLPNYAEAHSNYGQLLAERGDIAAGMEHFKKAVVLNPTLSRAHLNLGVTLAKLGRIDEAIAPLQQAVRLSPDSPEASYYLGSVFAAQNRYTEAADYFYQALRIQPDFIPAHQSLAQLLVLQGKNDEARQHYQEAVRLTKLSRQTVPDRR